MQKLRITFLAAVVAPIVASFSCGGSDNPATTPSGSKEAGTSGSSSGTGGSGTAGNTMGMAGTAGTMGIGGGGGFRSPFTMVDGGFLLKGCCDQTGVCGVAVQVGGFSNCLTAADQQAFQMARGGGRDGGAPRDGGFTLPPSETIVSDPSCPNITVSFGMGMGMGMPPVDAGPPKSCTYPKM